MHMKLTIRRLQVASTMLDKKSIATSEFHNRLDKLREMYGNEREMKRLEVWAYVHTYIHSADPMSEKGT